MFLEDQIHMQANWLNFCYHKLKEMYCCIDGERERERERERKRKIEREKRERYELN